MRRAPGAKAPTLFFLILLLPGCATPPEDPAPERAWTFTERDPPEPSLLGRADAFEANVSLGSSLRQIGGQWHAALEPGRPLTMRFEASVDMRVGFVVRTGDGRSSSGTCDWPADSTEEKSVGLGRARMRSTNATCEIVFTPTVPIEGDEATLRWEARAREEGPAGWTLRFEASG